MRNHSKPSLARRAVRMTCWLAGAMLSLPAWAQAAPPSEGDLIAVDVSLDEAPREVVEPANLALALDGSASARASFMNLAFGLRLKHVRSVEEAKSAEVRRRRIDKIVASMTVPKS